MKKVLLSLWAYLLLGIAFAKIPSSDSLITANDSNYHWIAKYVTQLPTGSDSAIRFWINEGLGNKHLQTVFDTSANTLKLYNSLKTALSKYHRKVIIREFDFEGLKQDVLPTDEIAMGHILENTKVFLQDSTLDKELTVSYLADVLSFVSGTPELVFLPEGSKLYRVCNDGWEQFTGAYWTRTKPQSIAEVIGGTAVQPEWNSFKNMVEFTIPTGGIWVWKGLAAPQKLSNQYNINSPHLAGGGEQIFIPLKYRRMKKADGSFDFRAINPIMQQHIVPLPNSELLWK